MDPAADFDRLVAPHRAGLEAHCYRMVGSVHDAEDIVQESLLRAWRAIDRLDGPVRPWLFAIATNRCLTFQRVRARRGLPVEWVEPYPDSRLDPAGAYDARESVRLAFVAALQRLPARQRAVLLLREVLAFPAVDVAAMLDTTIASVNSALQRARRTLGQQYVHTDPDDADVRHLADRYAAAWEAGDVDTIVAMLAADARYAMPPLPERYAGRAAIRDFLTTGPLTSRWRFVPTRANGQLAFGTYLWDGMVWAWGGLDVLTLHDGEITDVVAFLEPTVAGNFGLPMSLPPGEGI